MLYVATMLSGQGNQTGAVDAEGSLTRKSCRFSYSYGCVQPIRNHASTPNYQALEADSSGQEVIRLATRKIGESAITGRFMSVKAAQSPANKKTAIVRTIKTFSKPKGQK